MLSLPFLLLDPNLSFSYQTRHGYGREDASHGANDERES